MEPEEERIRYSQRLVDLCRGQPNIQSHFQDSQGTR
uniref:Lysine (K)-specific demethylase 2A n=1 Tax=Mus musculus TaxID=10090 RepID=A0A087WQL9_MOUSE